MLNEQLIQLALDSGATKATVIHTQDIVMSATFRDICKSNGCGLYGKCWMCPPDIGPVEELMEKVHSYEYGLLYQTVGEIEDSYDIEGMGEIGAQHEKNSIKLDRAVKGVLAGFPMVGMNCWCWSWQMVNTRNAWHAGIPRGSWCRW